MGFNLFGPAKTSDIRVGYISADKGYVEGVSICDANSYAKLNPGTTFILKNREKIRYLNINEVNRLTPNEAFVPSKSEECGGIQLDKPDGPPRVEFYGGGGVGVKANPVISNDGSLMAVHIVSGGNGYKFPPLVKVKDGGSGNKGGGVVARAGLGVTTIKTEVYDTEEEFEEYFPNKYSTVPEGFTIRQLCESEPRKVGVGFGRKYDPKGKDIGPWNPAQYVSDEEDPIRRQISQFQEYLAALTDPWWFIRKNPPISVVSDNEEGFVKRAKQLKIDPNRTVYPVQHWAWGGSLLTHGTVKKKPGSWEDVVFEIYTQGGHGRGLQFTFTEVGGDHTFVIKADDYTDSGEPRSITKHIKPNVDYTVVSEGSHKGRDSKTGTEQGLLRKGFGSRGREKGLGTSSTIFADLLGTNNDNDDLQILAKTGRFKSVKETEKREGHSNYELIYRLIVPLTKGKVSSSQSSDLNDIARSFMNDHAISPVPMSNAPGSDFAGMLFTMEWEEEFPFPGEYIFKGQCDNTARAFLDNEELMPQVATFKDKPSVVKKYLDWEESDKKGKVYKIKIDLSNTVQYKDVTVQEPPQKDSSDVEYEDVSTATAKFEGTTINDLALVVSGAGTAECTLLLDTNDKWSVSGLSVREMRCGSITLTRTQGRRRETLTGTAKFPAGRYPIEIIGASGGAGARVVSSTVSDHTSASLFKREGISTKGIADTRIELDDDAVGGFDRNASINLRVKSVKPEKRRLKAPAKPKPAPAAAGIKVQKVFNTVEWMGKANRQLWRTNVYGRGGFINSAGVCPFNTNLALDTNPYAGTHGIKWNNINFPVDGNYIIKVAVDDAVNLTFRGPGGETFIRKEGFINNDGSLPTGTSTYTRFFKKGNYTLDADLEQIPGGRFSFSKDAKGKSIKTKEVSFKVTSDSGYRSRITIPGLFSASKGENNPQINENFMRSVEVGKDYDVIFQSGQDQERRSTTTFGANNVKVRLRGSKHIEMEDWTDSDWTDIQCTITEGRFHSINGNRAKFRIDEDLKGINPMVLAVDVEVAYTTKTVISARSWQENPMGVAFTIKAPIPPVPIEEVPPQEGRCPNNPMWTTRFPTSGGGSRGASGGASSFDGGLRSDIKEWYRQRWNGRVASEKEVDDWIGTGKSASAIRKGILGHPADIAGIIDDGSGSGGSKVVSGGQWYPVRFDGWSEFLNRYAMSPVLPLNKPGSAEGGKVFTNTWKVDIPYDGYYQLRGEADDIAKYYIDGDLKLDLSRRMNKIRGTSKFFLNKGLKTIRVEVENYSFITYKNVSKKVFSARDWRRQAPVTPVSITGIVCHAGGGKGGTDNSEQLVGGKVIVGKGGVGGPGGDDNMYDSHHGGTGGGAGLRSGGSANNPLTHSQIDSMSAGRYKGGPGGFGVNFSGSAVGSIQQTLSSEESSGGNGVAMGGGGGGNCRGGKGGSGGNGGVKITWGLTSKSQEWTSPGVYNVTVPGESKQKNSVTIVCIGGGGSGFMDGGGDRQGSGGSGGAYAYETQEIEAGQKLKIVVGKGGTGKNVQGGENGGDSYVEVTSGSPSTESKIIKQKKGKVIYSGPNLFHYTDKRWGKVINKFGVSPANVDTDLDKPTPDNVGMKVLEWKNVDFPMKGQYDILFVADNKASLYINGEQLLYADENYTLNSDKSYDKINIGTPGRYDVKIELINTYHRGLEVGSPNDDVFRSNPSGVVLEIRKDVTVAADKGKPWTTNPVGVSGVLIPPPCPKIVGGKGVVTEVIVDDPGTGFDKPPEQPDDPSYPIIATLKGVRPSGDPINYDCSKDKIIMVPDLGYKLQPVCGPFGTITEITVTPPKPPPPITGIPAFYIDSPTGINLRLIPEFEITVVPPDVLPPEDIIQVTDLAGIKQTGYYNGKPYYGAVFYENGIKYAGWYATAGQPIQIYDTLQESIDATITTPPSAIQRQGSDISSNDPRLNIPGTPDNLT